MMRCSLCVALLCLLAAPRAAVAEPVVPATRTAAEEAGGVGKEAALPGSERVVVRLRRVTARPAGEGLGAGLLGDGAGFYVGVVRVGSPRPQTFTVLFDTASGHLVLPSAKCQNVTCLERRRYSPQDSSSAQAININGQPVQRGDKTKDLLGIGFTQIDLGDGDVTGSAFRDIVCLEAGGAACTELALVAAESMDEVPFRAVPYDGMIGLSLDALVFASPLFSFLRSLSAGSPGMLPQFGLSLRGSAGELVLGGPEPGAPRAFPLRWFPVARPEDGYWQVRIEAVLVGNRTVEACTAGCRGVVDTGASRLGVPAALAPRLAAALLAGGGGTGGVSAGPGGCAGPDLHLVLAGGARLTLRAQDYAGPSCGAPRLVPLRLDPPELFAGVFVLGEMLLRRYDTVFDWGARRVGFSLAAPRAVRLGPPAPDAEPVQARNPSLATAGDFLQMVHV